MKKKLLYQLLLSTSSSCLYLFGCLLVSKNFSREKRRIHKRWKNMNGSKLNLRVIEDEC